MDGQVLPNDLSEGSTPFGPRFRWEGKKLYQQSMMDKALVWEVPQTIDTVNPQSDHYNAAAAYAKTLRRDGKTWGSVPASEIPAATAIGNFSPYALIPWIA